LEKIDTHELPDPKTDIRDLIIKDSKIDLENDDNWFMIDGGDENIVYDETSGGFWYSLWRNGDVEMVKVVKKEFLLGGGERKVFFLSQKDLGVKVGQNLIDKKDKAGLGDVGSLIKKNTQELDQNLGGEKAGNEGKGDEEDFGEEAGDRGFLETGEFGNFKSGETNFNPNVPGLEDEQGNKILRSKDNEISPNNSELNNDSKRLKLVRSGKHGS
jgi:hypothetical protein